MKKYLKIAIPMVIGLIIIFALTWRLWSHNLSKLISVNEDSVTAIACGVMVSGAKEPGVPSVDDYQLQDLDKDDEEFTAILDILKDSKYRQSFRNLLPWAKESDTNESNKSAMVLLIWGDTESDRCVLTFCGNGKILVDQGATDGYKVYYAIDDSVLDKLVTYVQEHGVN